MQLRCLLIGLIFCLLPALVSAQLYRYNDERGVIHFTDNFIEIPENQRPKVEIITRPADTVPPEVETVPEQAEEAPTPAEPAAGGGTEGEGAEQEPVTAAEAPQPQQSFEVLAKTKADLDKIYDALAAEKEMLEKEQQTLKTIESIRAFQSKANAFNQRLADYERRRQAFQTQADAYNQTVSK